MDVLYERISRTSRNGFLGLSSNDEKPSKARKLKSKFARMKIGPRERPAYFFPHDESTVRTSLNIQALNE
jgi:hypothetical protein